MRRASAERMSSSAWFTLATMWNRSRMLRAWEHFSRITPKYGFHMSEQTNSIFADTSGPINILDLFHVVDVEGLGTLFANHTQIRFPHVRADELDLRRHLRANHGKEFLEGFHGPFLANPQQPGTAQVDLIHQGQIFVPFAALNLIHANGANRPQDAMLQPPGDQIFHRVVDLIPGSAKLFGGFLPGEFARPMPQKMHVNLG